MARPSEGKGAEERSPPRVVILGGGYGGVYTALNLQKAARRGQIELSLVSRDNFFLSQPMLAEMVSGSIEPPHIVNPIRRLLPDTNFHQAEVDAIDVENRTVIIRYPGGHAHYREIPYDHLVIAVGSSTDLSRLPGMAEYAFPFKTLGDGFSLRNHLISVMERAEVEDDPEEKRELLSFVVVGGGYTGVEVAAEINSFVREASQSYRHVDPGEVKVILLQGGGRILPELNEEQAAFSHRLLERRGIEVRLNTRIKGATAQTAILSDELTIPTRTLVAAIGSAPNRLLDTIPCSRDPWSRVVVDETLAVPECPEVWALGDCAAVPDLHKGGTCPPTAQYALREAKHLARNILAAIKGQRLRPFSYRNMGVFVPLGRFSAAGDVMGLKVSGFLAWWLYRTYYLYQLPRLERKLRVMIDWTLELIFRRDIVKMDVIPSQGINRVHYEEGEIIYRQGGLARNFYIIISGEVGVYRQGNGEERSVATLRAGEFFGEMSLLQGVRHTASVRALTPVDLLAMNGTDFSALAASSRSFGELLADVMRQRLSGSDITGVSRAGLDGENGRTVSTSGREE